MKVARKGRQAERGERNEAAAAAGGGSQAYGEAWYWDRRYSQDTSGSPFEWYQPYSSLSPLLRLYLPLRLQRLLVVGSGNSALSEGLVDDGYADVVSIDISSVVIQAMTNKYQHRPHLKFLTMDVRDMSSFQSGSFDAVIDKGTLDSILCGNNSRVNATMMLHEVERVLKDKGVYILITYGAPSFRLPLLKDSRPWTIKLHVIGKSISESGSDCKTWDLTTPIPCDGDESSIEASLGTKPDFHYIYVCIKDEHLCRRTEETASE